MSKMHIRFLSKDDRQLAQDILAKEGWGVSGTNAHLTVEIDGFEDAGRIQERFNAAEITWRDLDY